MRQRSKKADSDKDAKAASEGVAETVPPQNDAPLARSGLSKLVQRCLTALKYIVIIVLVPPLLNYAALLREYSALMPQGALYDVGFGQKIFMTCNGTGLPTVILDAPTGMSSDVWTLIFNDISKTTKVCMYDRAGLGFSERPYQTLQNDTEDDQQKRNRWQPYTVERMVDDLHRLITFSSQQPRPLILVGAEMGALVSRFFAQIYEDDVTDVVLIEPLSEDLFSYDSDVWKHYWSMHLVPGYQAMQLSAAVGLTRLALMVGATDFPMSDVADKLPPEVINRQKHLLCNPRHLSSVVDEHFFVNETFSQMQTVFRMKAFPKNVNMTVINGKNYNDLLSSTLNQAWAKGQQNFVSKLHPSSNHIVVDGADNKMLYRRPEAITEPIRHLVHQWRARQPQQSS